MKCSPKTMLKIGVVLALVLAGAAVAFPQLRPFIIGLAPFALFALCPLSMFFAMRGMNPVRSKTPKASADPRADLTSNGVNKDKDHHDDRASCGHTDSMVKKSGTT